MQRLLGIAGICALVLAAGAGSAVVQADLADGSWTGTYNLTGRDEIALTVSGERAVVVLGSGHAGLQTVAVLFHAGRMQFEVPGRPAPVIFSGLLRSDILAGVVRQAVLRGTFRLHRGSAPGLLARGLYGDAGHTVAVVDDPYGPERLVDLDSGEVHALSPAGRASRSAQVSRPPSRRWGRPSFDRSGAVVRGLRLPRLGQRELEVRFRSGSAADRRDTDDSRWPGPHAAAVFVQGSGETKRAYLPDLQAQLLRHGVAVLAYDKRGVGQSGGRYPGESPTASTIDVLAQTRRRRCDSSHGKPASIRRESVSLVIARRAGSFRWQPLENVLFASSSSTPRRRSPRLRSTCSRT